MWQKVAIFLAASLLTLGGVQVTSVRNSVSRDEVIAIEERESPYARDKQVITLKLENIANDQQAVRQQLEALRLEIETLASTNARRKSTSQQ